MKGRRILSLVLCLVLLIGFIPIKGNAYEKKDHDKLTLDILFRKYEYAYEDPSVQDDLSALTSACYLTIDQFNSYGQKYLDELIAYGVKGIPSTVNEISFTASGRNHRDFTHRGWTFSYMGEMKTKWPIRQDILRKTVDTVFNFNGNEKQKEAFCELMYYIHILGDHKDDSSYKVSNGRKMDVGGRHDKEDIIHKLLKSFSELFPDQRHTFKYLALTSKLQSLNSNFDKLVNSVGGINSDEKFAQHQELLDKLIKILTYYVPEMLKNERFFNDVFYRDVPSESIFDWFKNWFNAA